MSQIQILDNALCILLHTGKRINPFPYGLKVGKTRLVSPVMPINLGEKTSEFKLAEQHFKISFVLHPTPGRDFG